MSQSKIDAAINKAFEMQDAGKSDEEILNWIEKQSDAEKILNSLGRIALAFSKPN